MTADPNPVSSTDRTSEPYSADNTLTPTDRKQNALARNENPMPSTRTPDPADEFETTLTLADQVLLLQLTKGLEQRSASTPSFASEAILRQITGTGHAAAASQDRNRKRKLAGFTIAIAGLTATPFVVRPAITAIRGQEKPVIVATSTSAMPMFIVGGLEEKEILSAYVKGANAPWGLGSKTLRLRKGNASIDISTYGGTVDYQDPNNEKNEITPIQIGAVQGRRVVLPSGDSTDAANTFYEWNLPAGHLYASAAGVTETELLTILGSVNRTPFDPKTEILMTIGNKSGFVQVGESADPIWYYSVTYGPTRKFSFDVRPSDSLAEDSFTFATKFRSPTGREYVVSGPSGGRTFLTWLDSRGSQLHFGVTFTSEIEFKNAKPLTDDQFNEMVKLADSVREVDDETFAKVVTSHSFMSNSTKSNVPKKAPMANVLDGTIDGVAWKLTAGETPLEKECQKITFSGPSKPFNDCIPENPKDDFVSLGAANVGSANPKTVVFGVVKDTMEIIRVRNSEGTVIAEDFSIENGYLDGRAFAIELPTNVTGELTIEGYSYDDDVADSLPEGQFLPDEAKPLTTKTVSVE
jgi:hypothetical protein